MFIDTNVFVYARLAEAPQNQLAREMLSRASKIDEPICISRQILREYIAALTRQHVMPSHVSRDDIIDEIAEMSRRFTVLEEGPGVTAKLLEIFREVKVGGRQIHDANIVATMLAHGEQRLLTFDIADFRRYRDRIEILTG